MTEKQKALNAIPRNDAGLLTAAAVVDAARDEESPLHDSFEWDDTTAGEAWRLHQARNLIRTIYVEMPNANKTEVIEVREYASLTPDRKTEGGGYRSISSIMRNKTQREQLLADALADMAAFASKYQSLSELADVFAAMKRVRKPK